MGLGRCTKGPIWGYERWRIYKVIFHQEYGSGKPQVGHSYSPEVEAPQNSRSGCWQRTHIGVILGFDAFSNLLWRTCSFGSKSPDQQLLFFCQTCKGKVSWLASGSGSQAQKKGPKEREKTSALNTRVSIFFPKPLNKNSYKKDCPTSHFFLFLLKTVFRAHPSKKGVGAQMPLVYEGQKKSSLQTAMLLGFNQPAILS